MTDHFWVGLLVIASMGSGLIGGLFFIFSTTIMSAFDRLPPAEAVAAMNSINRVILNPPFFLAFFGTALFCVVLLVVAITRHGGTGGALAIAGSLIYLIGSIGVTMVCNVPLNNKLAAVSRASDMQTHWRAYRVPWTQWNHVRTVACLLSAVLFAAAIAS